LTLKIKLIDSEFFYFGFSGIGFKGFLTNQLRIKSNLQESLTPAQLYGEYCFDETTAAEVELLKHG
jgi:hypothetical protein